MSKIHTFFQCVSFLLPIAPWLICYSWLLPTTSPFLHKIHSWVVIISLSLVLVSALQLFHCSSCHHRFHRTHDIYQPLQLYYHIFFEAILVDAVIGSFLRWLSWFHLYSTEITIVSKIHDFLMTLSLPIEYWQFL